MLVSEQDPTCLCRFSKLADSLDVLADRNMQPEKEVAFLKKKVAIINKVFLNSDIPPKLRVRLWDPPRKAKSCCLLIAQDPCIAAVSSCGEKGTRLRFGSAPAKHAVNLKSMFWSLGPSLGLHGMGTDPPSDPH